MRHSLCVEAVLPEAAAVTVIQKPSMPRPAEVIGGESFLARRVGVDAAYGDARTRICS